MTCTSQRKLVPRFDYHLLKISIDTRGIYRKLDKIENYLANESFLEDAQKRISSSAAVVYIQEVWLEKQWRGRELGLEAVRKALEKLSLPAETIAILEPGPVRETTCTADEAGQKLAAHVRNDVWLYA